MLDDSVAAPAASVLGVAWTRSWNRVTSSANEGLRVHAEQRETRVEWGMPRDETPLCEVWKLGHNTRPVVAPLRGAGEARLTTSGFRRAPQW